MTPRTLDWRSVERKLTRMRRLLDRLVALGPFDRSRLVSDDVPTLAAERILTLLVDLAFATNSHVSVGVLKQAPDSYRESFSLAAEAGLIDGALATALEPSAGMRNTLVHAYVDVDYDLVAVALAQAPDLFTEYVRQVASWFADRATDAPD